MRVKYKKIRLRKPKLLKLLVVSFLLIVLIAGSAFAAFKYFTRPLFLKQVVSKAINEVVNGKVQIDSINFTYSQGLQILGLKIEVESTDISKQNFDIIEIPHLQIQLDYSTIFSSLLNFEINPAVEKVTIIEPSFVLRFDNQGNWLDEKVFNIKSGESTTKTKIPALIVQNAKLKLNFPVLFDQANFQEIEGISISMLRSENEPTVLNLFGQAVLPEIGQLEFNGEIEQFAKTFKLTILNNNILISRKQLKSFNPNFQQALDRFLEITPYNKEFILEKLGDGIKAQVEGKFSYFEGKPLSFNIDAKILSGAASFHSFPVPAELITGRIQLSNINTTDNSIIEDLNSFNDKPQIPNEFLSAKVVMQGGYKSSVINLEAEINNIGAKNEQLTVIVSGEKVLIDSYFKNCILNSDKTPSALKKFINDFQPSGIADISLVAGNFTEHFDITLRNINASFAKFPYEISDISGKVQGAGDLWDINDLKGLTLANDQEVKFDAKIRVDSNDKTKVIFNMETPAITIDEKLISILPETLEPIFKQHKLSGTVAVIASEIIDDSEAETRFNFEIEPINLLYEWDRLPYKTILNSGKVFVDANIVKFDNVSGFSNDTLVKLNGWINIKSGSNDKSTNLKIELENLSFDENLKNAIFAPLPKGVLEPDKTVFTELWNTFSPIGAINVVYVFKPDFELQHDITIFFKEGVYKYAKFPLPISLVSGELKIKVFKEKYFIAFNNFKGNYLDTEVFFEGSLEDNAAGLFLHLEANNCALDEQIRSAYETFENELNKDNTTNTKLWDMLNPSGIFDIVLDVFPGYNDSLFQKVSMYLDIREGKAAFKDIPYALENISGRIFVEEDGIRLQDVLGQHDQTTISVFDGFISPEKYSVKFAANNLIVDAELLDALPDNLQSLYNGISLKGRFDAYGEIQLTNIENETPEIRFNSILEFHNNSIHVGLKIENLKGLASVSAISNKNTDVAILSTRFSTAEWQNMVVTDGSFDLIFKDNVLKIPNIKCRLFNGNVRGGFELNIAKPSTFQAYFKVTGFDISKYIQETSPGATQVQGFLAGDIEVYGNLESEIVNAYGKFFIADALILDVPIVLKLFDFANYFAPTPVNEVYGEFRLVKNTFQFNRLDLFSDAVAFYGKGKMTSSGYLDLNFSIDFAPRAILYPLPLRWVVQQIEKAILPAYITGTISDPKISAIFPPGSGLKSKQNRKSFMPTQRPRNWKIKEK